MNPTPSFIFRCDGNPSIGSGHVMRCLSIAEAAMEAGLHCLFVTADRTFTQLIEAKGHSNLALATDYRAMDHELPLILPALRTYQPIALFADSYFVTPSYLDALHQTVREIGGELVYIDDVLKFAYPCDVLLNYNIYGPDKKEAYQTLYQSGNMSLPMLLLGTAYAPLRSEFQQLPACTVRRQAENILISTGGSDTEHMALGLVQAIMQGGEELQIYQFHFVIGAMNEDADKIRALAAPASNITLHFQVTDMCTLMRQADVAISAAGSTLYELCAAQTPTVTYVLADNQIPGADGFVRHGVMSCAGDVRASSPRELAGRLLGEAMKLAIDYDRRMLVSANMGKVADGNGARHIVEVLHKCTSC